MASPTTYEVESKTVPFGFAEVVNGVFTRYPNPLSVHVKASDSIKPWRIGEDGALYGTSVTLKTNPIPQIMKSWRSDIFHRGTAVVAVIEEYRVNLEKQMLTHLSWNLSNRHSLRTHERVEYTASSPQDPIIRVMIRKQMACLTPNWNLWMGHALKHAVSRRWKKNSYKQSHGLCYTIANNNYCPKLAHEFLSAGQSHVKWTKAVERLQMLRESAQKTAKEASETAKHVMQNPQNMQRLQQVVKKVPKP